MAATKLSEALFGTNGTGSELLQFLAESGYLWSYRGKFDKAVPILRVLDNDPRVGQPRPDRSHLRIRP